jgi:hypothetical protein
MGCLSIDMCSNHVRYFRRFLRDCQLDGDQIAEESRSFAPLRMTNLVVVRSCECLTSVVEPKTKFNVLFKKLGNRVILTRIEYVNREVGKWNKTDGFCSSRVKLAGPIQSLTAPWSA